MGKNKITDRIHRSGPMSPEEAKRLKEIRAKAQEEFPPRNSEQSGMRWSIRHGDILDVPADILICSANPFLNLSGGVGGALSLRYGHDLQTVLHDYLKSQKRAFVERGSIVETGPCGTPYLAILHAVAVDAFYESSIQIVQDIIHRCLLRSAELDAKVVALTALATGYGRLTIEEFGQALSTIKNNTYPGIEETIIVIRKSEEAEQLMKIFSP